MLLLELKTAIFFMWRIEQRSDLDSVAIRKLSDMKKKLTGVWDCLEYLPAEQKGSWTTGPFKASLKVATCG